MHANIIPFQLTDMTEILVRYKDTANTEIIMFTSRFIEITLLFFFHRKQWNPNIRIKALGPEPFHFKPIGKTRIRYVK